MNTLFDISPPEITKPKGHTLRPYQQQAVDAIFSEWEDNQSTLLTMPTGTGKTVVMSHVIDRFDAGRVMLIAHREELIYQARGTIQSVTGIRANVEMAERRARNQDRQDVVVASVQTLISGSDGGRVTGFNPYDFGMLLIDEAHHATAASYRKVLSHFKQNPSIKILGVTATPDRTDEEALGQIFETVAYDYEISDAIVDGWLTPIQVSQVNVDGLDLSEIRTTAGDLNGADLARVMEFEKNLHAVAHPAFELAHGRRTLVFAASVAQAERLCEILNRHQSDCAKWVCGTTDKDERRQMLADYNKDRFQFLVNVGVATEGFDSPGIACIAMARPTKSRSLYAQMAGRGTRPLPGIVDPYPTPEGRKASIAGSAKPFVEIIDFTGNSGKHKLISAADILGGNYSDEVIELANNKVREGGRNIDALKALEDAQEEIADNQERERLAEESRRAKLKIKTTFKTKSFDPFALLDIAPARERGWDKGKPLTDKMRALLERQGIDTEEMNFAQGKQLIGELMQRWDKKLCTLKQAAQLKKRGLPTDVPFDKAREWMDAIAKNHWQLPPELVQFTHKDVETF